MIVAVACFAAVIYFEARSEPLDAQMAVAEVVINRMHHPDFPDTICAVVKEHRTPVSRPWACQFSFYCDGKSDVPTDDAAWLIAQKLAVQALSGATLGHGAVYYHTVDVSPAWRHNLTEVGVIGSHVFYTDNKCVLALGCSLRPQARPEAFE